MLGACTCINKEKKRWHEAKNKNKITTFIHKMTRKLCTEVKERSKTEN